MVVCAGDCRTLVWRRHHLKLRGCREIQVLLFSILQKFFSNLSSYFLPRSELCKIYIEGLPVSTALESGVRSLPGLRSNLQRQVRNLVAQQLFKIHYSSFWTFGRKLLFRLSATLPILLGKQPKKKKGDMPGLNPGTGK